VLLLAVFGFRMFPTREVTVLANGQATRVNATFDPETEGLMAAQVSLSPGDKVLYAPGDRHSSVAVQRAHSVTISIDGRQVAVQTQASTVGGALADAGLQLHPGDTVFIDGQATTPRAPLVASVVSSRPVGSGLASPAFGGESTVNVQVQRSKPATVVVDTMRVEMSSSAKTVEGLLEDLGMTVREGDLVRPSLDTPVTAGMVVKLAKARTITVVLDGQEQSLYTQAQTVGDVIRVLGLTLGPEDSVSLPLEMAVQNGLSLNIARTIIKDEDVRSSIPPSTINDTDPSLPIGQVQVVPGVEGVQTVHYSVTYKNGVEVKRDLVSTEVTQQPVPTRRIVGTKPAPVAPRPTLNAPGYTGPFKKTLVSHVTWYNASQGAWDRSDPNYGRTASGAMVDYGICATDWSVIPEGTHLYIPGYGSCVAGDTGGAIKGNDIDLGFPESAGNSPWATQDLEIYILD
jgi:uncharacterized protein YabE (DUF348 family)/3D (Asp-Asp-Asp) domain-containing protein